MAVGAYRLVVEARMKAGHAHVARVTQVCNALSREQMAISRTVWGVAGDASLDDLGTVFENEGPALVLMAGEARVLFEATQGQARLRAVGIVAVSASDDAFLETMSLVELEFGQRRAVTGGARGRVPDALR